MALPIVPNIAKGKWAYLAGLPAANDALIWALIKNSGLEADTVLRDYDDLAAILAASNDEATFTGYSRQTATGVTVTVDDTNDRVDVDANDPSWSPTTSEAQGAIVCVYDADTTTGTDSALTPVFIDAFAVTTPTSGTTGYTVAVGGFLRAA